LQQQLMLSAGWWPPAQQRTHLMQVGHTVGLGHMGYVQNGVRQEYYRPPNGPTLWVPIMGVPGNGLYAQWSNGRSVRLTLAHCRCSMRMRVTLLLCCCCCCCRSCMQSRSYPPGVGTPTNTEDEIAVISGVLPLAAADAPGATGSSPRVLCVHVPCANVTDRPDWVESTTQAVVEHGTHADRYSFSADASNKSVVLSLVYRPNWHRSSRRPSDGQVFLNNWRTSMLRLALAFDQPGVNVTASLVNPWSTQQDFEARLPGPGEDGQAASSQASWSLLRVSTRVPITCPLLPRLLTQESTALPCGRRCSWTAATTRLCCHTSMGMSAATD
jgi:hypothetical protein